MLNNPAKRDFSDVLERLKNAVAGVGGFDRLGEITSPLGTYPLIKILLGEGNPKRILISAGIHGDEPAGVEAVCGFLETRKYLEYVDDWEISMIPCINPSGYELGTRNNYQDTDLNRVFKQEKPPEEVRMVQSVFEKPFDLTLELHEDEDSPGYYCYQKGVAEVDPRLGFQVVSAAEKIMPLNLSEEIEGTPAETGVIHRLKGPGEMQWWPMALYALSRGAKFCMTLETGTGYPIETRVAAHLAAMREAIERYPDFLTAG